MNIIGLELEYIPTQFGNPMTDDFLKDLYDLINKFRDKEE